MAEHLKLDQYDDDLTVGLDDFNDDLYVDEDDLLRYQAQESPLTKLKSIVISIDWEISDEILLQFNEEILALREVWGEEKYYLVYLQALEQISKYIYQEKTEVHPNAVKLLPVFFQNLERISSSETMTEEERDAILVSDVKRFNLLKKEITEHKKRRVAKKSGDAGGVLQNLKALVLGIDWEVTEEDLGELRREVMYLENLYRSSKPRLILLQGIGTLATYIQHKSGNAHASAFSLLHEFFGTLEDLAARSPSPVEEKEALLVQVEKFNAFKKRIATTLSPEALQQDDEERKLDEPVVKSSGAIAPAFAEVDPEESVGFQEEVVAVGLGESEELSQQIGSFFIEEDPSEEDVVVEAESRLDDVFGSSIDLEDNASDRDLALKGVDVETEADDDSEEEALAFVGDTPVPALLGDMVEEQVQKPLGVEVEAESRLDDFFGETSIEDVDQETLLKGVDVETDADDESEEEALARIGDTLAPALSSEVSDADQFSPVAGIEEDSADLEVENTSTVAVSVPESEDSSGIEAELDSFFGEDDLAPALGTVEVQAFSEEEELLAPALSFTDEAKLSDEEENIVGDITATNQDVLDEEAIEDTLDSFFGDDEPEVPSGFEATPDVVAPALSFAGDFEEDDSVESFAPALSGAFGETATVKESEEDLALAAGLEDTLDAFFGSDGEEEDAETEVDLLKDYFDEGDAPVVVADETEDVMDDFFGLDEADVSEEPEAVQVEIEQESDTFTAAALGGAALAGVVVAGLQSEDDIPVDDVVVETNEFFFEEVAEETPEDYIVEDVVATDAVRGDIPDEVVQEVSDVEDIFEGLNGSISSLGFDLSEDIVEGVLYDINTLRQKLSADPIAKSFLQLLSTLSQHILKYQYEASSDAFTLLASAHEVMAQTISQDMMSRQNALLAETFKVLHWQQGLIDLKENVEVEIVEQPLVQQNEIFFENDELTPAAVEEESDSKESDVESLRGELQELRVTFKDEIARLRTDLLDR